MDESIKRVQQSRKTVRANYDRQSTFYDRFVDPLEAPARTTGIEMLDVEPGETVLDIGCGTGEAMIEFSHRVEPEGRVIGVDLSREMCHRTRKKLDRDDITNAGVVEGDATTLPFPTGEIDAGFLSFVLDLIDTPEIPTVLGECARVLGDDGRVCIVGLSRREMAVQTRIYEQLHEWFPTILDCRPLPIQDTVEANGFDPIRVGRGSLWGVPIEVVLATPE